MGFIVCRRCGLSVEIEAKGVNYVDICNKCLTGSEVVVRPGDPVGSTKEMRALRESEMLSVCELGLLPEPSVVPFDLRGVLDERAAEEMRKRLDGDVVKAMFGDDTKGPSSWEGLPGDVGPTWVPDKDMPKVPPEPKKDFWSPRASDSSPFDLSSSVRARLTEAGVRVAKDDDLSVDDGGVVHCSMKEFMRTFGPHLWSNSAELFIDGFVIGESFRVSMSSLTGFGGPVVNSPFVKTKEVV